MIVTLQHHDRYFPTPQDTPVLEYLDMRGNVQLTRSKVQYPFPSPEPLYTTNYLTLHSLRSPTLHYLLNVTAPSTCLALYGSLSFI
jgi:hypothetical protein